MAEIKVAGARARMEEAVAPTVHVLDPAKAARLGAKTMLMPSPLQVEAAILAIPIGSTKTLKQLRRELADASGAEMTCPVAARHCWKMVAEAAEEDRAGGREEVTPWWRLTKDGEPWKSLPGGESRHRELLQAEGVLL